MTLSTRSRFHPLHPDLAIVTLAGEVDVYTAARLRDDLAALLGHGARHLVLDLTDVTFIDSSGLSVLAGIHRLQRTTGTPEPDTFAHPAGTLALTAVNPRIREVLRTTGLTRIFPIYSTVELAILVHQSGPHRPLNR
jgi:anti-anti-sigma factor